MKSQKSHTVAPAEPSANSLHLMTTAEAATLLRVSPKTITRKARAGKLKSYRIGRLVRYDLQDVVRVLEPVSPDQVCENDYLTFIDAKTESPRGAA
jgi:excisionase family DNA binding protein